MAFVTYVAGASGYEGTLMTNKLVSTEDEVAVDNKFYSAPNTSYRRGSYDLLLSPIFNTNNTPVSGWVTLGSFSTGGGGGCDRPTTGMLYPRRVD